MSVNDRINQELEALHKELDQLHHYSVQIGEARQAATDVSKAAQEFINHHRERVTKVTEALDEAAYHFGSTTKAVSQDFVQARDSFQMDISDAGQTFKKGIADASISLSEVESRLQEAAERVRKMSTHLEDMDIPGQFRKMQDSILAIERQLNAQGSDFSARLTGIETGVNGLKGKLYTIYYLAFVILIVMISGMVMTLI